MRVLVWHVHGSYLTGFVQGGHDYLLPVTPDRGPDGRGRARTWEWPAAAREMTPAELRTTDIDVVVLQDPSHAELTRRWTGRVPGRDVPAVYLEHNLPRGDVPDTVHPVADQSAVRLVHVTRHNALMWDNGRAPVRVVEHGVVDPGPLWTGELARGGVVVNEPVRRGRVVGADLLAGLSAAEPLDVFGMGLAGLTERWGLAPQRVRLFEDLPQHRMHTELARRRVYVHPLRWTSLGLSLIEAMHLGMPVVALGVGATPDAVPPAAGCVSADPARLADAVRELVHDHEAARACGKAARAAALERFSLGRFLADWDDVLQEVVSA